MTLSFSQGHRVEVKDLGVGRPDWVTWAQYDNVVKLDGGCRTQEGRVEPSWREAEAALYLERIESQEGAQVA